MSSWCELGPSPGLEPAGDSHCQGGKGQPQAEAPWAVDDLGKLLITAPLCSPQGWQGLKVVAEILNLLGPDRDTTETPGRRHPQPGALFGMALVWDFSLSQS